MKDSSDFGKLPPQAVQMEEKILGVLILINHSFHDISDFLTSEMFYNDEHKIIYNSIVEIHKAGKKLDILTLSELLRKKDQLEHIGGIYYLSELTEKVGSSDHITEWAQTVSEKWMYRELISICQAAVMEGFNGKIDPFDLLKIKIEELAAIIAKLKTGFFELSDYFESLIDTILQNQQGETPGIKTGFHEFDQKTGGLHKGNMIVLAGETSQGKTAVALNIANYASKQKKKVLILSYEMTGEEMAARFMAMETHINSRRILYSRLENEEVNKIHGASKNDYSIFIDECHSASLFHLEKSINNAVINLGAEMVIIDYIQKVTTGEKKIEEMAHVSGAIKQMAKKHKSPILALSQLSRDANDHKPSLRRLRWAGEIEQDADIVWFIYRPESYGLMTFDFNNAEVMSKNTAAHLIAKGRNVGTFDFLTDWNSNSLTFPEHSGNSMDNFLKEETNYFTK